MNRDVCYICGNKNRDVLEQHHIVPRRFGGSDDDENLVQLCSNCHTSVERLYDKRFYEELGVEKTTTEPENDNGVCHHEGCASTNTERFESHGTVVWTCSRHRRCEGPHCEKSSHRPMQDRNISLISTREGTEAQFRCYIERKCYREECSAEGEILFKYDGTYYPVCEGHAKGGPE